MTESNYGRRFFTAWAIVFGAATIILNAVESGRLNSGWGNVAGASATGALPPIILLVTTHAATLVVRHAARSSRITFGFGIALGGGALASGAMAFGGSFTALTALATHWHWSTPVFLPLSLDIALLTMSLGSVWTALMVARDAESEEAVVDGRPAAIDNADDSAIDNLVDRRRTVDVRPTTAVDDGQRAAIDEVVDSQRVDVDTAIVNADAAIDSAVDDGQPADSAAADSGFALVNADDGDVDGLSMSTIVNGQSTVDSVVDSVVDSGWSAAIDNGHRADDDRQPTAIDNGQRSAIDSQRMAIVSVDERSSTAVDNGRSTVADSPLTVDGDIADSLDADTMDLDALAAAVVDDTNTKVAANDVAEALRLRHDGASFASIAAKLGVGSHSTVSGLVKAAVKIDGAYAEALGQPRRPALVAVND